MSNYANFPIPHKENVYIKIIFGYQKYHKNKEYALKKIISIKKQYSKFNL